MHCHKKLGDFSGISYLSEVGARGLLNLGKKHLDHQIEKTRIEPPF